MCFPISPFKGKKDFPNWEDWPSIDKTTNQSLHGKLILSNTRSPQWQEKEEEKRLAKIREQVREDMERCCPDLNSIQYEREFNNRVAQVNTCFNSNDDFDNANEKIEVKNLFDFIEKYTDHPESKYDDLNGNMCNSKTKGLLKPAHIKVKAINLIGKEAETIQDEEEQAILPDEMRDAIKIYQRVSEITYSKLRKQALNAYQALPEIEMIKKLKKAGINSESLTDLDETALQELAKGFPGIIRKSGLYTVQTAAKDFEIATCDALISTLLSIPSRDDFVTSYVEEQCRKEGIKLETIDWEIARSVLKDGLKEKGITQKGFAEKLGITLPYFKDLLSGRYFPSADLHVQIIAEGRRKGIRFPDGKEPMPKTFRNDPYPIARLRKIETQLDKESMIAFRSRFDESIFPMYQTELVFMTPDVIEYVKTHNELLRKNRDDERAKAIPNLKIVAINFGSPDKAGEKVFFEIDDIGEIWVVRDIGKGYACVQIELRDGRVFTIYKKHNPLAFDLKIFPEPSPLYKEAKVSGRTFRTEGKYPKEYTKRKPFPESGCQLSL